MFKTVPGDVAFTFTVVALVATNVVLPGVNVAVVLLACKEGVLTLNNASHLVLICGLHCSHSLVPEINKQNT